MTPPIPDPRATAVAEQIVQRMEHLYDCPTQALAERNRGDCSCDLQERRDELKPLISAALADARNEAWQAGYSASEETYGLMRRNHAAALADAKREALTEVVALAEAELQNARDNPLQPYDYYLSTLVNALRQLKLRAQEHPRG